MSKDAKSCQKMPKSAKRCQKLLKANFVTEAILTNNLAAINPNQEIVSDNDLETSETKNTNFSKVN